ncbi:MAG: hypothetical protein ACI8PD_001731 [Nitrospinales bacterium]|jgi:hypothetical protein
MQRFQVCITMTLMVSLLISSVCSAGGVEPIPSLNNILRSSIPDKNNSPTTQEMEYSIKKFYYQIQYRGQKLQILNEVKGHFEKSISKAEEKYDEGEEDISQSDITKLKLGLAGTLNDIFGVEADLQISRLSLFEVLNSEYEPEAELIEPNIMPVEFGFANYQEWSGQGSELPGNVSLQKVFFKVVEAKKKMQLARNNRKITRALLVSEVANYDFGIGNPADLFQALIIYTRVLSGYYDSVYKFNLSVAGLNRDKHIWMH